MLLAFLIGSLAGVSDATTSRYSSEQSSKLQGLSRTVPITPALIPPNMELVLRLRAGSDSEDSEAYDDDNDLERKTGSANTDGVVGSLIKGAMKTTRALIRAVTAAFDFSEVDSETSMIQQPFLMVQRMWNAAFASSSSRTSKSRSETSKEEQSTPPVQQHNIDFGAYLGNAYGVDASREDLDEVERILTGSFQDALKEARNQARLLVVFIPVNLPKKKDKSDAAAVESFLSADVAQMAKRKAKKGKTTGSFLLWSAKAGSPEAALVMKRLKAQTTNTKGQKRPILLVIYPNQVADSLGLSKMAPRLLAQHHCSPPPTAERMAAWLNALRKRHAKQYTTMQIELREHELLQERKEGYRESVKTDIENKLKEEREAAEKKAREEAEKKRAEEIAIRREILRENLPEEPDATDSTAYTLALRLLDGRSAQRRFASEATMESVFGWVDAHFEIEQETITLMTMNGKVSLTWEDRDTKLEDARLPKKAGIRVIIHSETAEESSD